MKNGTRTEGLQRYWKHFLPAVFVSIFVGLCAVVATLNPHVSGYSAVLVISPVFLSLIVVWDKTFREVTANYFVHALIINTVLLVITHILYSTRWATSYSDILRWIPVAFALATILMVLIAVGHLLGDAVANTHGSKCKPAVEEKGPRRETIADFIRKYPFHGVTTAFSMFLFVTCFLAYAIAIDDCRAHPEQAASQQGSTYSRNLRAPNPTADRISETSHTEAWAWTDLLVPAVFAAASVPENDQCATSSTECKIEFRFQIAKSGLLFAQSSKFNNTTCNDSHIRSLEHWAGYHRSMPRKGLEFANSISRCYLIRFLRAKIEKGIHVRAQWDAVPTEDHRENFKLSQERGAVITDFLRTISRSLRPVDETLKNIILDPITGYPESRGSENPYPYVYVILKEDPNATSFYQEVKSELKDVSGRLKLLIDRLDRHVTLAEQGDTSLQRTERDLDAELKILSSSVEALRKLTGDWEGTTGTWHGFYSKNIRMYIDRPNPLDYIFLIYAGNLLKTETYRSITPFAMFTVTMASAIQLFFVVVFFNLVVAALPYSRSPAGTHAASEGSSEADETSITVAPSYRSTRKS